jgi:Xaa-Pro aminopeptidase
MQNQISKRISDLREWLVENQLEALIVPHEDEYLGEYLPSHHERLQWITGFTGSAGIAVITRKHASLFVDGRYTVQVTKQAPSALFEYHHLIEDSYPEWIIDHIPPGSKVAFDPRLHPTSWFTKIQTQFSDHLSLCPLEYNPIDKLWFDRPTPLNSKIWYMDEAVSGKHSQEKRLMIASSLKDKNTKAAILTQPDSICWLLNIRGHDVSCLPVLLCYAVIYDNGSLDLFIDPNRVENDFHHHVGAQVTIRSPDTLESVLASLSGQRVQFDPTKTNTWFSLTLHNLGIEAVHEADPCALLKAVKNTHEITGMKACHIRDGAAMVKFLSWLDHEVSQGILHDEHTLSVKLGDFRQQDATFIDFSFDTISAAGSNAAMCHYNHLNQPAPGRLMTQNLYLVDSGAHYRDGTTDITRTIAIGQISKPIKQQFTLVLKGHIALANARFPQGTTGHQLDALARQYLWAFGYDFDHGTGHGVGHCLNVHEGPQRISKTPNAVPLIPGMVVSNEPGYYRENGFGIRIENLELVVNISTHGDFDVFGFESLTRCPIDLRIIEPSLLTKSEIQWLNNYHQLVWDDISPLVTGDVLVWLKHATRSLEC